jgi:hypothetical protein
VERREVDGKEENPVKHAIVHGAPGLFAGWPANNGAWCWGGREILVGFTAGAHAELPGHNIREPYRSCLARSLDQGETWTVEEPHPFAGSSSPAQPFGGHVDFAAPGFALRIEGTGYHGSTRPGGGFFVSENRGRSWQGPFSFGALAAHPEIAGLEITARTDYLVECPRECLVFMSARGPRLPVDRTFCARTVDGGRSFAFVSWVVPPSDPYRAVMPSTVRLAATRLVSAIRRREPGTERCWLDAYASSDNGLTWNHAGRIADTGGWNGNPPALVGLVDGRLCCVYGDRATCRMMAAFSADGGATWTRTVVLRDDFHRDAHGDPDLGYPRVVQQADGKLLACYYWATRDRPCHYIASTLFQAASQ